MAIYYAMGNALVTRDELHDKKEELTKFSAKTAVRKAANIKFSTGKLSETDVGTKIAFVEVGLNKPLSIELRHLYTGAEPRPNIFGKKKDMLVSTALKGFVSYDAAPKAINHLRSGVKPFSDIRSAAALQGTPLVFYSPAVTQPATLLSLEVIFDNFPKEVFEKVSSAVTSASAIPVFSSASLYLLAAGLVVKLAGRAGESLFDGDVAFRFDDEITFERPGSFNAVADFRLLTRSDFDQNLLTAHSIGKGGALVDKNGLPYKGDHPYAVISLDGRKVEEYEKFVPTAMSAALLDRFYSIKDGKEQSLDILIEALSLYNDVKYRTEADKLKKTLDKAQVGSEEHKKLQAKYEALIKNIGKDELRPEA